MADDLREVRSRPPAGEDVPAGPARVAAEYLILALLVGIFLWRGFLPGWRSVNTDFPNYYLAARLYRQGYTLSRVYDWLWFQRQKDHAGLEPRLVEFIPSTPFAALVVAPVALLPPLEAKRVWLVANLLLLLLTGVLLHRLTSLGARRVAILTFLAITPLRDNFAFGQQHVPVLFLLTLAAGLYFAGRTGSAGAALAFGAALRLYPGLFLFFFVRKKQWRAALALAGTSVGLVLVSAWLFGFASVRAFAVEVLPRALKGEDIDPYDAHWNSFTALLRRLLVAEPGLNPHPLVHFPAAYALLQPLAEGLMFVPFLWLMGSSRSAGREKLEWGGYVAVLLVMSTHPAAYHFCALILVAALVTDELLAARLKRLAGVVVGLYSFACLPADRFVPRDPSGWRTLLAFPRLYALTALVILLLWQMSRFKEMRFASLARSREAAAFAAIFAALVAAGAWTNLRHLKGQFENYKSRLEGVPPSLLAGEPAASRDVVAFTMMSLNWRGYVTGNLWSNDRPGSLHPFDLIDLGGDTFHPTFDSKTSQEWVELASTTSRIVRLHADHSEVAEAVRDRVTVEVENAEQPSLSPDGRWLAFIRETEGRGSLWVKDLGAPDAGATRESQGSQVPRTSLASMGNERQVVDSTWDVLDTTFLPGGRVVFAAEPGAQERLFIADLATRRVTAAEPATGRARYPAVSPNGKWLAYAREERGNWQIYVRGVRDLQTAEDRRLTGADCNSITPGWLADSKTLIYSTDCGRGLGLTALAKISAVP